MDSDIYTDKHYEYKYNQISRYYNSNPVIPYNQYQDQASSDTDFIVYAKRSIVPTQRVIVDINPNKIDVKTFTETNKVVYKLLKNQRKLITSVGNYGPMSHTDFLKVESFVSGDIFSTGRTESAEGNECCLYTGYVRKNTGAQISYNGKKVLLSRLLYLNYIEDIIQADNIVNICDNKGICCKLAHLSKVTRNSSKYARKRLTEDQVRNIIYMLADKVPIADISKEIDVSTTCILNIKNGKTHKNIVKKILSGQ